MNNKINLLPNSKYPDNKQKKKKIKLNAKDFLMHIPGEECDDADSKPNKKD